MVVTQLLGFMYAGLMEFSRRVGLDGYLDHYFFLFSMKTNIAPQLLSTIQFFNVRYTVYMIYKVKDAGKGRA